MDPDNTGEKLDSGKFKTDGRAKPSNASTILPTQNESEFEKLNSSFFSSSATKIGIRQEFSGIGCL